MTRPCSGLLFVTALVLTSVSMPRESHAQGRSGSDSPGQQALEDGKKALLADDYSGAEGKFRQAIQLDSKLNDAYWRLAAILYGKKRYSDALDVVRRAPDPSDIDVREQTGLALYKMATPPSAESVRLLEEVIQRRPESYAAQLQLGQHLVRSDPKRAAIAIEAYLKYRPPSAGSIDGQTHLLLGTAYVYARDWDAAQREFEGILKTKPNDVNARLMLGSVLVGKNACGQAIALYERILSQARQQPSIYYNLGTCYLRERRPGDALREAELYAKLRPGEAKAHLLVCDVLYEQAALAPALKACEAAERLEPASAAIKTKLGRLQLALRNPRAAVTYLEQALAASPTAGQGRDADTLVALAESYVAIKAAPDKLLPLADELHALGHDVKAQTAAGQAYYVAGRDDSAQAALEAAVALEPAHGSARATLVQVLNHRGGIAVDKGELATALELLATASRLAPEDAMTSRNLAVVLLMSKKHDEAETVLQRALRKTPNDVVLTRLWGRALAGQHKTAPAIAAYEKAAQLALHARGPELAGIYAELGPLYADADRLDQAVSVLETAIKEAGSASIGPVAQRNLAIIYYRRGLTRLRDAKQADAALDDLSAAQRAPRATLTGKEAAAIACATAWAALQANKPAQSEAAWDQAVKNGGENACAFRPPYDKLGVRFFAAYAQYRDGTNPAHREAAVKFFAQLAARSSGPLGEWLHTLARSGYELLAYDAYQRSEERHAAQYLATAAKLATKEDRRELEHNLAVIDLSAGRTIQAERLLDALGAHPCEARLNLGILYDRQGDSKRALELFKQARTCGARTPKLSEWIDVKERLFGGSP